MSEGATKGLSRSYEGPFLTVSQQSIACPRKKMFLCAEFAGHVTQCLQGAPGVRAPRVKNPDCRSYQSHRHLRQEEKHRMTESSFQIMMKVG